MDVPRRVESREEVWQSKCHVGPCDDDGSSSMHPSHGDKTWYQDTHNVYQRRVYQCKEGFLVVDGRLL